MLLSLLSREKEKIYDQSPKALSIAKGVKMRVC